MFSLNLSPAIAMSGSGIDVTSVVNQILDSKRGPERIWQQQQATLTLQSTALGVLNTDLTTLQSKVQALTDVLGVLNTNSAISSDNSILTATADSTAVAGTHTIVVNNLATTSSYYTDPVTIGATLSDGTMTLQVGSGTAATISIDAAHNDNTLSSLASFINGQNLGVTATVVNDASGQRLAIVSGTSGQPGDLTITSNVSGLTFHKPVTGTNASLTVDGVPISSSSNTVTGTLPGVTLNLAGYDPGTPVQLTVGPDTASITQALTDLVDAYNVVISAINLQYAVDPTTYQAGPLANDSLLGVVQSSMLSDISYSLYKSDGTISNNGIMSLASLGITMQDDGTMSIDNTILSNVLSTHYSDVVNFFQNATTGFATNFNTDLNNLLAPTTGAIAVDQNSITTTKDLLTDSINNLEDQLAQQQITLTNQYSLLNAALEEFPFLMEQTTSLLGTLSTSSSS